MSISLSHAAVMTVSLEKAVLFYQEILNLDTTPFESDPLRDGLRRCFVVGPDGQYMIELIEMPSNTHVTIPGRGAVHHLGLTVDRDWGTSIRNRLRTTQTPFREAQGKLFVRDADGLVIEIETANNP